MNSYSPSPTRRHLGVPSSLFTLGACLFALSLGAARLSAQTNIVTNGSFETGTLNGWTYSGAVATVDTLLPFDGADGSYLANFGAATNGGGGYITQSIQTAVGTTYTLSFDARYLGVNSPSVGLTYTVSDNQTNANYLNNTLWTHADLTANGSSSGQYTTNWNSFSYTFTAASTDTKVRFFDATITGNGSSTDLQLDNISVAAVSAVPEPSTYAAFAGLGALGLVALRRRRTAAL